MLFPLISAELGVFAENTSTASNVSGYTLIIKGLNLGIYQKIILLMNIISMKALWNVW